MAGDGETYLVAELLDLGLAEGLALHELGDPAIDLVVGRHDDVVV
jgi:hypothetical protein